MNVRENKAFLLGTKVTMKIRAAVPSHHPEKDEKSFFISFVTPFQERICTIFIHLISLVFPFQERIYSQLYLIRLYCLCSRDNEHTPAVLLETTVAIYLHVTTTIWLILFAIYQKQGSVSPVEVLLNAVT